MGKGKKEGRMGERKKWGWKQKYPLFKSSMSVTAV
jgi:hypothetical protein